MSRPVVRYSSVLFSLALACALAACERPPPPSEHVSGTSSAKGENNEASESGTTNENGEDSEKRSDHEKTRPHAPGHDAGPQPAVEPSESPAQPNEAKGHPDDNEDGNEDGDEGEDDDTGSPPPSRRRLLAEPSTRPALLFAREQRIEAMVLDTGEVEVLYEGEKAIAHLSMHPDTGALAWLEGDRFVAARPGAVREVWPDTPLGELKVDAYEARSDTLEDKILDERIERLGIDGAGNWAGVVSVEVDDTVCPFEREDLNEDVCSDRHILILIDRHGEASVDRGTVHFTRTGADVPIVERTPRAESKWPKFPDRGMGTLLCPAPGVRTPDSPTPSSPPSPRIYISPQDDSPERIVYVDDADEPMLIREVGRDYFDRCDVGWVCGHDDVLVVECWGGGTSWEYGLELFVHDDGSVLASHRWEGPTDERATPATVSSDTQWLVLDDAVVEPETGTRHQLPDGVRGHRAVYLE